MAVVTIRVGQVGPLWGTQFQGEWARFGYWTIAFCPLLLESSLRHYLNWQVVLLSCRSLIRLARGLLRRIDLLRLLYLLDRRLSYDRST